jgi:hypothetical protein
LPYYLPQTAFGYSGSGKVKFKDGALNIGEGIVSTSGDSVSVAAGIASVRFNFPRPE